MDVLVSGDQMGAFGDAGGRLQLVPRQHPDLRGAEKDANEKQAAVPREQLASKGLSGPFL